MVCQGCFFNRATPNSNLCGSCGSTLTSDALKAQQDRMRELSGPRKAVPMPVQDVRAVEPLNEKLS
jgi:hypothetical protein